MVTTLDRRSFLLGCGGAGIASVTGYTGRSTASDGRIDEDDTDPDADSVAVVSQHHLATEAGLEVLVEGGTAADAAVAVACALSVVEPWFSSALGGGTWALYYDSASDEVTSVDGVGPVGAEATPEDYEERAGDHGMHQSVVPGAWDGWMLWLDRYGELDLKTVLSPAITIARDGYPVSPGMADWLDRRSDRIAERPDAAAIYESDGELLEEGDTVSQDDMAETFEALADAYADHRDEGRTEAIQAAREYFYRGPIAEAIVEFSDEHGGYLTLPDFHDFEAELVDPISIDYDEDVRVYQNPPNSQGITQLLALNVLKEYDLSGIEPDDADAVHVQAEAMKLAFADRYHHVGDPDRVDVPVAKLLDEEYGASQRDRIEMDSAMEWPIDTGLADSRFDDTDADHTTTFHVVDEDGNAAAVTTSLGAQFQVIGDTGIHLNNRMRMLALEDDDPNQLTPGYKVRHTSNPYMATHDGQPYILGGNTGVDTQPQGQTQQFVHVAEFGLGAQAAINRPRFETTAFPSTQHPYDVGNTLEMEEGFSEDIIDELEQRGHDVDVGGSFGAANMIVVDEDGDLQVGAESRSETAEGVVSRRSS
ncbi:gamma-glutamyltransferase family protein [Natrialbaceae archaeon A-arb3/5]